MRKEEDKDKQGDKPKKLSKNAKRRLKKRQASEEITSSELTEIVEEKPKESTQDIIELSKDTKGEDQDIKEEASVDADASEAADKKKEDESGEKTREQIEQQFRARKRARSALTEEEQVRLHLRPAAHPYHDFLPYPTGGYDDIEEILAIVDQKKRISEVLADTRSQTDELEIFQQYFTQGLNLPFKAIWRDPDEDLLQTEVLVVGVREDFDRRGIMLQVQIFPKLTGTPLRNRYVLAEHVWIKEQLEKRIQQEKEQLEKEKQEAEKREKEASASSTDGTATPSPAVANPTRQPAPETTRSIGSTATPIVTATAASPVLKTDSKIPKSSKSIFGDVGSHSLLDKQAEENNCKVMSDYRFWIEELEGMNPMEHDGVIGDPMGMPMINVLPEDVINEDLSLEEEEEEFHSDGGEEGEDGAESEYEDSDWVIGYAHDV